MQKRPWCWYTSQYDRGEGWIMSSAGVATPEFRLGAENIWTVTTSHESRPPREKYHTKVSRREIHHVYAHSTTPVCDLQRSSPLAWLLPIVVYTITNNLLVSNTNVRNKHTPPFQALLYRTPPPPFPPLPLIHVLCHPVPRNPSPQQSVTQEPKWLNLHVNNFQRRAYVSELQFSGHVITRALVCQILATRTGKPQTSPLPAWRWPLGTTLPCHNPQEDVAWRRGGWDGGSGGGGGGGWPNEVYKFKKDGEWHM